MQLDIWVQNPCICPLVSTTDDCFCHEGFYTLEQPALEVYVDNFLSDLLNVLLLSLVPFFCTLPFSFTSTLMLYLKYQHHCFSYKPSPYIRPETYQEQDHCRHTGASKSEKTH